MSGALFKRIEILMIEDSPTDALIAREAIDHAKVFNTLHVVDDGVEAMSFLRKEGQYGSKPKPDLILLDLNLPKKSGQEVLAEIKADESLKTIPVVVLTSSKDEADIFRAYGLHANCFISKPVDFSSFVELVRSITQFWFAIVTLPPGDT